MSRRGVLLAGAVLLFGCTHQQTRLQSDDEPDRDTKEVEVKTIGDISQVDGVFDIPVVGVGLVLGLEGTGGGVPPGNERTSLEDVLKKKGVTNIQELFNSKTTSLVRVSARVPAAARKNDAIDLFVTVPENSRTTSLKGGTLAECVLYNFDTMGHVSEAVGAKSSGRPDGFLRGHAQVMAKGRLLVGLKSEDAADDAVSLKSGIIWGGGRYIGLDRPILLSLNPERQVARVAMFVIQRVNETFHGPGSGLSGRDVANAHSKYCVELTVPGAYRLNLERFIRVVRLIPLSDSPVGLDSAYVRKYEKQLLDPATTITAALRLEALGPQSIAALKVGLNSDVPMVRFAAAESLAYLGSPSCGEELAKQVVEQPFVQAFALTALASLNEAVCRVKLQEMLAANCPETRYGAWRALRALDDRDPLVEGEKCGEFWVHSVARHSAPQIHLSMSKRPEVVLFGPAPALVPPFTILAGEFTLKAEDGDEQCTLCRFKLRDKQTRKCSLEVAELLRTLADLSGDYADAVEILRQADSCRGLNCVVKSDALPKAPTVYDLARAGVQLAGGRAGRPATPPPEMAVAPTLYERPAAPRTDGD
jgi:hypothetical protein